ncbi:hypothetical protein CLIM01_04705 [Colletotrichum limetticola]|uniref:Ankyrin repeat protein n=1 Tax=Colletotrichum limetticola TaxID=1209924 RepID=A0ABQ9Q2C5_9PEZI|nr:hypothetical protein CLIM01_04705 [Colletotrichum limetticola]
MGANPLFFALRGSFDSENRALWEATSTKHYRFGTEPFVADDTSGSRLDIVKALIKARSSLVTREKDKVHALHQACAYRDVDVVRFLLEEVGVDPNTRDSKGDTALHYVAANQSYAFNIDAAPHRHDLLRRTQEIVNLLIDKGSNINAQNVDGQSPADIGLYARSERELWAPGGSYGPSRLCI